nr:two component system response regulator [uncultured Pseudomonas sp.]
MADYRVLLVDDHQLLREGLKALLQQVPGLIVVGEAEDGRQALDACHATAPDLIVLDLNMPVMDGLSTLPLLRRRWPHLRILALTSRVTEQHAAQALDAGADGYVLKRSPGEVLVQAIRALRAGKSFLDGQLDPAQVAALRDDGSDQSGITLTDRERQILKLVAEGSRNRDIAELLCISLKTVETHRLNLMKKLDAHNSADLTQWAFKLGVCSNE